jgi:hypothetical protein
MKNNEVKMVSVTIGFIGERFKVSSLKPNFIPEIYCLIKLAKG